MAKLKVSEVVSSFLDMYGYGQAEYRRAYSIAIRGWRELNWDVEGDVQYEELQVRPDLTAELPHDCLNVLELGVPNGNRELAILTRNDSLNPILDVTIEHCEPNYMYDYRDYIGFGTSTSLGIGSSNVIGEYKVDMDKRLIVLNPEFTYSCIVMKYLKSSTPDGEYFINELASEALLAYIEYVWHRGRNVPMSTKQDLERRWYNEKRKAKRRIKPITKSDLNHNSRQSAKGSLKM